MKEVETLCVVAFILFVAWAIETLRDSKMAPARRFWLGLALAAFCAMALVTAWHVAKAREIGTFGVTSQIGCRLENSGQLHANTAAPLDNSVSISSLDDWFSGGGRGALPRQIRYAREARDAFNKRFVCDQDIVVFVSDFLQRGRLTGRILRVLILGDTLCKLYV
jgi:hypothetical protein